MKAPMKTKEKKVEETKEHDFSSTVGEAVLSTIGKPSNFYKMIVKHVFADNYRVNIWCEVKKNDFDTKELSKSYFVTFVDGKISKSIPAM
jgi:hypothetical protein